MVLSLKRWKSRTPPGFVAGAKPCTDTKTHSQNTHPAPKAGHLLGAGWSSPVARQAHNLKVTGSNPVPATTISSHNRYQSASGYPEALFYCANSDVYSRVASAHAVSMDAAKAQD